MAQIRKILLWVVGLPILLIAAALAGTVWWISSWSQHEQSTADRAAAALNEARTRFAGARPAFEMSGNRLVVVRQPPAVPAVPEPAAVYLLMWAPDERTLSRVRLPLWISTVSTEPIPLEALVRAADESVPAILEARRRGNELNLRMQDLKAYGRALLLDGMTSSGRHVVIWTE